MIACSVKMLSLTLITPCTWRPATGRSLQCQALLSSSTWPQIMPQAMLLIVAHYAVCMQEFVERKLTHTNLGQVSSDFATAAGNHSGPVSEHPDLDRLYARFEENHGFDGRHAVCAQATHIAAAMKEARESWGWSAFTSLDE